MIEKIEDKGNYDEIWLSEMPTPTNFKNNLIVWVDDIPKNNLREINTIVQPNM